MQLENVFRVPVSIDEAWGLLLDPERVATCLPGATLESVEEEEMRGRVKVKLGPMSMLFRGTAQFVERDDANYSVRMQASGKDTGGAGAVKAEMRMSLAEVPGGGTECTVLTDLAVSGKAAQFGRGVMADVSSKLVAEFADRLARQVEGGAADPSGAESGAGDDALDLGGLVDWRSMVRAGAPAAVVLMAGTLVALLWRWFRHRAAA
jgi:carbon monoxide dehydrogenase subunit G